MTVNCWLNWSSLNHKFLNLLLTIFRIEGKNLKSSLRLLQKFNLENWIIVQLYYATYLTVSMIFHYLYNIFILFHASVLFEWISSWGEYVTLVNTSLNMYGISRYYPRFGFDISSVISGLLLDIVTSHKKNLSMFNLLTLLVFNTNIDLQIIYVK